MSLKKNYLKSKPICKVTFTMPVDDANGGKSVQLVGEFNEWDIKNAVNMRKVKENYTRTLELEVGKAYQFRYLVDGENWVNDSKADAYVPNGISYEENCVVEV